MTYHGLPRSVGVLGCLVHPWPINGGLSTVSGTHDYNYELFVRLSKRLGVERVRK
jgi:hypothetical protein